MYENLASKLSRIWKRRFLSVLQYIGMAAIYSMVWNHLNKLFISLLQMVPREIWWIGQAVLKKTTFKDYTIYTYLYLYI